MGIGRFVMGNACFAAEMIGSILLISGYVSGLYVASMAMVPSFAFFISGAWLLIIGVYESQIK
jgi:hypothetical protein